MMDEKEKIKNRPGERSERIYNRNTPACSPLGEAEGLRSGQGRYTMDI